MDPLQAARQGKEEAFLELFDEHHLPLFHFACRMTGCATDAEDLVQECFLELVRPGCAYDPARTPLRSYLYGVVRNQVLKRRNKAANWKALDVDPRIGDSPERHLLRAELEDAVARAVMELPDTQREVLILAHYQQLPLAEIAQVMDLEVGAVKSRLQRARAQLKETLAAYATGPRRQS
jgi:RNA polymerase sigma-70 factor, ECF subfamily